MLTQRQVATTAALQIAVAIVGVTVSACGIMADMAQQTSAILARRSTSAGILISDDVVNARLAWPQLRSADGHDVRVEWTGRLACVDAPADRQLLMERFGNTGDVTLATVTRHFEEALAAAVGRTVEVEPVARLVAGACDRALSQLVESEVRRAAFAVGMSIVPPFALRIVSPTLERDRRIADVRGRLESMDVAAAAQVDPLDLLRATAGADRAWSAAMPLLWVVAGTRIARVDPTRPSLDAENSLELPGELGPLRSVSGATVDGIEMLLVGARDGVLMIDKATLAVARTFHHATGSDFGFNSAGVLAESRVLVATHASAGVVAWRLDEPTAPPIAVPAEHARSLLVVNDRLVAFTADGRLATCDGSPFITSTTIAATAVVRVDAEHLAAIDDAGNVRLLTSTDLLHGSAGIRVHAGSPVVAAAGVDLAGVPRVVVASAQGGLRLLDFVGAPAALIGPPALAVRALASRPGHLVAVGVDRTRLHLINLAQPDAVGVELHVAAALGSRVADARFA